MKILLHICCGVCASSSIEQLLCKGYNITGYFYNPNIHPVDEYKKRLDSVRKVAKYFNIDIIEEIYNREVWFPLVKGFEYEKEGEKRCSICFHIRLLKTYDYFKKNMFDLFTTTLTISPFKDTSVINNIGLEIGKDKFLCENFKKNNGFNRSIELAKKLDLYRQNYCGCIYSLENRLSDKKNENKKK